MREKLLRELAERYGLAELTEELDRLAADETIEVGFLGEYSSGKSLLINSLVGQEELLPVQVEPTTARLGRVAAVEGLEVPRLFVLREDGTVQETDRGTFEDVAHGRLAGQNLAWCPPARSFPAGFVFVDTPGLGSLNETHAEITFGVLPLLDAAVICVDMNQGGLRPGVVEFLKAPGVRHFRHRFLVALTHADELLPMQRGKVKKKVIQILARELGIRLEEAEGRVTSISSGGNHPDPGTEPLVGLIAARFEERRATLRLERTERATRAIASRLVDALQRYRDALRDTPEEFARRKAHAEKSTRAVEAAREQQRERLKRFYEDLYSVLKAIRESNRGALVAAKTKEEVETATAGLAQDLGLAVASCVDRFAEGLNANARGIEADLRRVLDNINRGTELGKTLVTAALTAWLVPGGGAVKDGIQAGTGAMVREAGAKGSKVAAGLAAGKAAAKKVGEKAAKQGIFKQFLGKLLQAVDDINPVNYAGDLIGEQIKKMTVDEMLSGLVRQVTDRTTRLLEDYFEQKVFAPLEAQQADLQATLSGIAEERRTDNEARAARASAIDVDIQRVRAELESAIQHTGGD